MTKLGCFCRSVFHKTNFEFFWTTNGVNWDTGEERREEPELLLLFERNATEAEASNSRRYFKTAKNNFEPHVSVERSEHTMCT